MRHDVYRPLTVQELTEEFQVEAADDFKEFVRLLNEMEDNGDVVRTRTNRYGVPERMNLVVGKLQLKARGFGFLSPDQSDEEDVYVAATDLNGAMSGDRVMVRIEKRASGNLREGQVIRILERAQQRVVGVFTRHRNHAFIAPMDRRFPQDIFIDKDDMADAHDGYVVVVEITSFPTVTRGPAGRVVEVLGHPDAPGIDILAVVRKYGLEETFPEDVLTAAEEIPLELSEKDYEGRRDLRDETIVTIDGEDAKDLDDAVHVRLLENGNYLLGVSIADVGYYVKENGVLDREALSRGTSVYLVDRVIPMLPQRLSNNICSLNPHIDRLTMTCEMEWTPDAELVRHDIYPSVIRTTERMTYTNVKKILADHDEAARQRYRPLIPMFEHMEKLALVLRGRRMKRGAVDFDFDEIKVAVDNLGRPIDIAPRQRSIAERIIEEFMLAANETVAEHFHWLNVPFLYRVHEEPDVSKMSEFNEFIHNFGYHVKGVGNVVHPRALQEVLDKVRGKREERVISTLMLRSMRQARYAPDCTGHFGLAADYYTHFTSPIRRYPDLMIHRIMREILTKGKLSEQREEQLHEKVDYAALRSSDRERNAQDAERECDQLKMVEYMQQHLGEEFDGLISGVTQFGLFIQLKNGVEGLIHISYLTDDYYVLNDRQMALVGERNRRVFRLGDPVRVKVAAANKEALTIDFEMMEHYREGTMVFASGQAVVEYDEDLGPEDRERRVAEREYLSRPQRPGRGGRGRDRSARGRDDRDRNDSRGGRSRSQGKRNGPGTRKGSATRRAGGFGAGDDSRTGSSQSSSKGSSKGRKGKYTKTRYGKGKGKGRSKGAVETLDHDVDGAVPGTSEIESKAKSSQKNGKKGKKKRKKSKSKAAKSE
ncbi:ribonuclease R [Alicyclobacillus sp. SO9]|nr:ribonuclease R [Alicyclobacillus sp. SO9]